MEQRVIQLIFGIHLDGNLGDTAVLGTGLGLVRKFVAAGAFDEAGGI